MYLALASISHNLLHVFSFRYKWLAKHPRMKANTQPLYTTDLPLPKGNPITWAFPAAKCCPVDLSYLGLSQHVTTKKDLARMKAHFRSSTWPNRSILRLREIIFHARETHSSLNWPTARIEHWQTTELPGAVLDGISQHMYSIWGAFDCFWVLVSCKARRGVQEPHEWGLLIEIGMTADLVEFQTRDCYESRQNQYPLFNLTHNGIYTPQSYRVTTQPHYPFMSGLPLFDMLFRILQTGQYYYHAAQNRPSLSSHSCSLAKAYRPMITNSRFLNNQTTPRRRLLVRTLGPGLPSNFEIFALGAIGAKEGDLSEEDQAC